MLDITVWPEIILGIALWVKSKMASISARLSYKLTIFSAEWAQKHNFGVYRVFMTFDYYHTHYFIICFMT